MLTDLDLKRAYIEYRKEVVHLHKSHKLNYKQWLAVQARKSIPNKRKQIINRVMGVHYDAIQALLAKIDGDYDSAPNHVIGEFEWRSNCYAKWALISIGVK